MAKQPICIVTVANKGRTLKSVAHTLISAKGESPVKIWTMAQLQTILNDPELRVIGDIPVEIRGIMDTQIDVSNDDNDGNAEGTGAEGTGAEGTGAEGTGAEGTGVEGTGVEGTGAVIEGSEGTVAAVEGAEGSEGTVAAVEGVEGSEGTIATVEGAEGTNAEAVDVVAPAKKTVEEIDAMSKEEVLAYGATLNIEFGKRITEPKAKARVKAALGYEVEAATDADDHDDHE